MTTLIFVFMSALFTALVFTPLIKAFARQNGILHKPGERDSHIAPKPRIGGIALFFAFFTALAASLPFQTDISILIEDHRYLTILGGATIMFVTGLVDDLYHLRSSTKLFAQLMAGLITWYGGVKIGAVSVTLGSGVELGWLSLPVTLFWIVLVTNAINLIDGLDGLAAGVVLFASLMMLVLCVLSKNFLVAVGFAALAGSTLGFLRYNFNPASIFMGDSGSYFLGYAIATLSILGSVKGQTALAMLIPLLALGVPIFDAMLSPLRRFARGKQMFSPDHSHLHHKLMESGASHRRTVLILYSASIVLSITAFILVYVRDERAALVLMIPAAVLFLLFKKIGYLNYFAIDKIYGWLRDVSDSTRISHGSRTFLDHHLTIQKAGTIDELWFTAVRAFAFLELDQAILVIAPELLGEQERPEPYRWNSGRTESDPESALRFKIEYPLMLRGDQNVYLGRLMIHKYTEAAPIKQFTIRRIEQIQRDMTSKISELLLQQPVTGTGPRQRQSLASRHHVLKN